MIIFYNEIVINEYIIKIKTSISVLKELKLKELKVY